MSLPVRSRKTPQEKCQEVVSNIADALKHTIPGLSHDKRAFSFQFEIHIRDGLVARVFTDTWDDTFEPIALVDPMPVDHGLTKMLSWLQQDILQRSHPGYHGISFVRVNVQQDQLSFSTRIQRQRLYS